MDTHIPYVPESPFDTLFQGRLSHEAYEDYLHVLERASNGIVSIDKEHLEHLVSQYDGSMAQLDAELARLIENLKRLGMYENTLVMITSDHGEAFGEKNLLEHGMGSVYQPLISVPLIVKFPCDSTPEIVQTPVSHVDIMPTALDVLGISATTPVQGRSLFAKLDSGRFVISEAFPSPGIQWQRAIISDSRKLILGKDGRKELYDLEADPSEKQNLYGASDSAGNALERLLVEWVSKIPKQADRGPARLSKEDLERLRSLGYTQ